MGFAAALSEHPLPTHAIGECVGQVLEKLGPAPDLAILFATAPHAGAIEDIASVVSEVLQPAVLIGATASSVLGGSQEVEETAAISLLAGEMSGRVTPIRLEAFSSPPSETDDGVDFVGLPAEETAEAATLLLMADPFSFPSDVLLARLANANPQLQVVGGLASAATGPGGNRLVIDDMVHPDGAVGVLLANDISRSCVVSQGCRPIGEPFVVTNAERNVIYELGGKPALERLLEIVNGLSRDEVELAGRGLHIGKVIDEQQLDFNRGDFLIRNVMGADRSAGAVAVGDTVEVGGTVQFQVRDSATADEDLQELMAGHTADAALVFTCNGRGTHLFESPDHDARVISDAIRGAPLAGMFCAGEVGPIGGRSFLHGFTASVLLFG